MTLAPAPYTDAAPPTPPETPAVTPATTDSVPPAAVDATPSTPPEVTQASAPETVSIPKSDWEATQQQIRDFQTWRQQREQAEQQARQQQATQQYQQLHKQHLDKALDAGMDPQEAQQFADARAALQYLSTPEGRQEFQRSVFDSEWFRQSDWYQAANHHALNDYAWQLIQSNFAHQLTLKSALELHQQLVGLGQPQLMAREAQRLAEWHRRQYQQGRVQSGAERIEGGGGAGGGGMSDQQLVAAYARGEVPWSARVQRALEAL